MKIDKNSFTPLYLQIEQQLTEKKLARVKSNRATPSRPKRRSAKSTECHA